MTTETFTFWSQQAFQGLFTATQAEMLMPPHAVYGWQPVAWDSGKAVLYRSPQEIVRSLRPLIAAQMQPQIDQMIAQAHGQFGDAVTLTVAGGPFTQIALWPQVPYAISRPGQHGPNTQLLRVDIDLHLGLPWPAQDADANLSWYVYVRLEGGLLKADVDGAWVTVHGGWPRQGDIANALGDGAIAAIGPIDDGLHAALAAFAAQHFRSLYLIPGDGSTAAAVSGFANVDTAIGLVLQ